MGKYRVYFKKQLSMGGEGDNVEYGILVEANTLAGAQEKAIQQIPLHGKLFLGAEDVVRVEQLE